MHSAWLAAPCAAVYLWGADRPGWRFNAAAQALSPDHTLNKTLIGALQRARREGVAEGEFEGIGETLHWHGLPFEQGTLFWLAGGIEGAAWRNARIADLALGAAGIGIWETDLTSGAVRWDAQVYALHGLAENDPRPPTELQLVCPHPDDLAIALGPIEPQRGGRWENEYRVVWPDGSIHWLASRAQVLNGAGGKPLRLIGIYWDITDSKERTAAERRRQAAEDASRAKSEFFARISHDLRTPTNAVLGYARLLLDDLDEPLSERQHDRGQHVVDAGEHLLAMLSDLLDLGKIEAGTLVLAEDPIALAPLVEQTLHWLQPLAERFGVALAAEPIDAWVSGDAARVRQVVAKLLGNAVRDCRDGGQVTVSVRLQPQRRMVGLSVRDTGRGLDSEQLRSLFDPLARRGLAGGTEGSRISMHIVQDLVERMGGRLEVTSVPGEGSDFSVWLRETAPPRLSGTAAPASPRSGQSLPLDVLCIEDDPVSRLLMQEILTARRPATRLAFAEDGASGLALIARQRFDVVLMDMNLPDMDGFELLARLRASEGPRQTPCIAMSADAMPEFVAKTRTAGFHSFWTKPIDFIGFVPGLDTLALQCGAESVTPPPASRDAGRA